MTARLRREGLATEAGRRASTGGKPRTLLRLVPEAGHALGVHLDRDELRAVLVDLDGTVVGERRSALDLGAGAETVVEGVARAVEALAAEGLRPPPPVADGPRSPVADGEPRAPGRALAADGGLRASGYTLAVNAGLGASGRVPVADGGLGVSDRALVSDGGPGVSGRAPVVDDGRRVPGHAPVMDDGLGVSDPALVADGGLGVSDPALVADGGLGVSDPALVAGSGPRVPGRVLDAAPTLLGLGVALPGPLDHVRGVLHRVTGFPEWDGFPLRDALARRLGVPVVVDKDTNAAALGLAVGGEGGGEDGSFAYLHLGTGLGAGLVFGGGVHRGARTGAGEFGHQVVQLDGPPCTCGARGCIEALCLAAVARGDLAEAARVLGAGAANLAGLLDIDLVLLGGRTVAAAPEAFVHGVGAVLDDRARREGGHDGAVPVRIAPGGTRGVAEGAAQLLLAPLFGRGNGG
nr:ROK family protein [Streptomyces sp. AC512_CC834]